MTSMNRRSRTHHSLWLSLIMICVYVMACEDQFAVPRERQILIEVGEDGIPLDPYQQTQAMNTHILVNSGESERTLPIDGEIEIGAFLFDHTGEPSVSETVGFRIIGDETDGAALTAQQTLSNEDGYARMTFFAGDTVRDYEVEITHENARPIRLILHVVNLPAGALNITFDYEGPVGLERIELFIVERASFCENPFYLSAPEGIIRSFDMLNPSSMTAIERLVADRSYAVVARARVTTTGTLAAGGCVGDVRVIEGERRQVTVPLLLIPLNPAGRYDVINQFDFTDAIPGQVGVVVDNLVRFFGDQNSDREIGGLIFDAVEVLAREAAGAIGGLVIELIANWVEDDLNDLINRYIDEDAPDIIRDFFTIGSDLVSVVSHMEVISEMNFTKPLRDGVFEGAQNWIGLAFYWRLDCEMDAPPDCGRYPFTMDQLVDGANGINLVFGQFDGRVHSYNQGIINEHTMDLQYGRLILFIFNQILLPRFANGATSLSQGLLNLANCPGFAERLTGGRDYLRLGGINIVSRARIEDWCETAMSVVGDGATYILSGLEIDTRMSLQGSLVFVEDDNDLAVDRLEEGVWWGSIRTSEDAAPPFEGEFFGEKEIDDQIEGGATP